MPSRLSILLLLCLLVAACAGLGPGAGAKKLFDDGLGLYNQGRYAEAAERFAMATQQKPDYAEAYLYLGRSQLNLGRYPEAFGALRTAWRLDPQLARGQVLDLLIDAALGAAAGELERGNLSGGLDYFKQGLELAPEGTQGHGLITARMLSAGGQLLSGGRALDAAVVFRQLLAANPAIPLRVDALLGMARAYLQGGRVLDALEAARGASRLNPDLGSAEELLRRVQPR